jgi:hypothetical protein
MSQNESWLTESRFDSHGQVKSGSAEYFSEKTGLAAN